MTKYLIINADDFGMSRIFNYVILDLIKKDLISSTTVMVNRVTDNQKEQFDELIALSQGKNLSVGLHLEFKDSDYPSQIKSQYNKFKEILGFNPSHLDIHKASTIRESISPVANFCRDKEIPCRNKGGDVTYFKTTASPSFHGSIEDFSKIEEWIKTLEDEKYYEILFHPGKFDPGCKSSLNKDRERDVEHIKKLNNILEKNNIKVVSYLDLGEKGS